MSVVVVSMKEAQERLTELVGRVAAGDYVVIAENGRPIARLTPPPVFPITEQESAANAEARLELIRNVVEAHDRDGPPLPADHPLRALLEPMFFPLRPSHADSSDLP